MIHHVQLACPAGAENTLREFYGGVLGLAEVTKPPALARNPGGEPNRFIARCYLPSKGSLREVTDGRSTLGRRRTDLHR